MKTYKEILQILNDMGMSNSVRRMVEEVKKEPILAQIVILHRTAVVAVEAQRKSESDAVVTEYLGLLSGVLLAAHEPTLAGRLVELNLQRPEVIESALANAAVMATIVQEVTNERVS